MAIQFQKAARHAVRLKIGRFGALAPAWKGGRRSDRNGYVMIFTPDGRARYTPEHVLVVEKAIGKRLRVSAPVHHADEDKTNNEPSNLVACDSRAYHGLLHKRLRALQACGNANAHRCFICGSYDNQRDISLTRDGKIIRSRHRACRSSEEKRRRVARQSASQDNQ